MTVPHKNISLFDKSVQASRSPSKIAVLMIAASLAITPLSAFAAGSSSNNDSGDTYNSKSSTDTILLIRAKKDIRNKDYQKAYNRITDGLASDAKNPDLHNLLGFSARKLGRYEISEKHYSKALELDPKHKGALEYMGELYLTLGKPEEAEKLRERLSDICWLGCKELKMLDQAISDWKKSNS